MGNVGRRLDQCPLEIIALELKLAYQLGRLYYVTAAEVARRIGVRDTAVSSRLQGEFRPANPERIAAFLDSLPTENGSDIAPTGYEYREYKNWRGIPKPRRCPFCKQAKGVIRRSRGGLSGCVQIAMRVDRSGRPTKRHCGRGMGRGASSACAP